MISYVEGSTGVQLLECTNPVRGRWRIRWNVQQREDGRTTYVEKEFDHKPTVEEIRQSVINWYNEQTDETILSGFTYKGMQVWLSSENQFNYKTAYDLAVQTSGASLPVTFKFGTDEEPKYHTFTNLEELTEFYTSAVAHVQAALAEGWSKKDSFSLDDYR